MTLFLIFSFFCLLLLGAVVSSYVLVDQKTATAVHTVDTVPAHKVGLVLGCRRMLAHGRENLFFTYRIRESVALYEAGKIQYVLVSGDNSRKSYDEASDMQQALMERGVPEDRIVLDYAGFRTLDSVLRASKVFGQESFIVVSQDFHVRRALFIAQAKGLDVVGVAAQDVEGRGGLKTHVREYLARFKMMLDLYVLRRGPKFLGEPISIGEV
ncbi:ElyC/SanA/YdcF family protein [Kiritimatiellota bacterium B12222]|nr:ElyC/SanA/YdcF family protein [Kiritimatiellota bacterium B12222]